MAILYAHHSLVSKEHWPFQYFIPRELANKGDGSLLADMDAIARLDHLRELLGKPLIINSAYRDPLYNARVGGAPRSMHKQGKAFDVALRGHNKRQLIQLAKQAGFTGFGINYNTFLHIDTGRPRQW